MKTSYPYSKEVMEHFRHPRGLGSLKNPSSVGEAGNLLCGDVLRCFIKVGNKGKKKVIKDIKMQIFGCVVAIANSSMITTLAKGKTLEEALKIDKNILLKKLGRSLPLIKYHCSVLAADALHEAIYNYYLKNKIPIPKELQKEHERIQKTLHTIEERHKKYVEMEKEVLGK